MKRISAVLLVFVICFLSLGFNVSAAGGDFGALYRDSLTSSEKTVYDTFLSNSEKMKDGKTEIKIYFTNGISKDDISTVLQRSSAAFVLDHPECFWISYEKLSFTYIEADGGVSVITAKKNDDGEYYFPSDFKSPSDVEKELKTVKKKIDEIIKKAEEYPSAYEKVKYFHDYLCQNNIYNEYVRKGEDDKADKSAWRAYSALTSNNDAKLGPVCEGYSKAFKMLCDRIGIPCVLIPGEGINGEGEREAHMWCCVFLSGKWYGVDVTWDDAIRSDGANVMRDNYFLCGEDTEDFSKLHIPDMEKYFLTSLPTPKLASKKYDAPKAEDGCFLSVSGFSATYGDKADVRITFSDELKGQKISLYKNHLSSENKIYESKSNDDHLNITVDTLQLSCVNDKRIVAVYEDENGSAYISCADITLAPKALELDSSDITLSYEDGTPHLSGELTGASGEKLLYTVKSEISEDGKKMTVSYTDIVPLDMNHIVSGELTLEFELPSDNTAQRELYKYIVPAVIVIFCLIVSLLKRK